MSPSISITTKLAVIDCQACGWVYGIPEHYDAQARKDSRWAWRCPNPACSWEFVSYKTGSHAKAKKAWADEKARLERSLESSRQAAAEQRERADTAVKSRNAFKGQATRVRKRLTASICPCPGCKRSFPGDKLAAHLKSRHPGFVLAPDGGKP